MTSTDAAPEADEVIAELESLAAEVLSLKRATRPRRPIVLEFCGSPKAGKTSAIHSLDIFLRRNSFRTRLITERAAICPIDNKFDPLFNIWTSCSAICELAEVLAGENEDLDIVICDRGIFDALSWFTWLRDHSHLDDLSFANLAGFLTMERFRAAIDLVFVFTATSAKSLEREYANLLTRKTGSVMNPAVLDSFVAATETASDAYREVFQRIETLDTSDLDQNRVSYQVTKRVLGVLRQSTMESIGHVDLPPVARVAGNRTVFSLNELVEGVGLDASSLEFGARTEVEADDSKVQFIPILVLMSADRTQVAVFRKRDKSVSDDSPEKRKTLPYIGGHIRQEDHLPDMTTFLEVALATLRREVEEEINLVIVPDESEAFCIWDRLSGNRKSARHVAVCFTATVNPDATRLRLDDYELVVKGARTKSGRFISIDELAAEDELEAWGMAILEKVFERTVGVVPIA